MAARSAIGSVLQVTQAAFASGVATTVTQIGGNGVPTPQSTATTVDYQTVDSTAALKITTGSTYSDVTFELAWDATAVQQQLYTWGKATSKVDVTFTSKFPNNSSGFTVVVWVGQVTAANLTGAVGGLQKLTLTITPQSETSVTFA